MRKQTFRSVSLHFGGVPHGVLLGLDLANPRTEKMNIKAGLPSLGGRVNLAVAKSSAGCEEAKSQRIETDSLSADFLITRTSDKVAAKNAELAFLCS
jgi:hypothetical protein